MHSCSSSHLAAVSGDAVQQIPCLARFNVLISAILPMIWLDGHLPDCPTPGKAPCCTEVDLKFPRLVSPSTCEPHARSRANRKFGIAAFASLSLLLCTGATAPAGCPGGGGQIGPSGGEVIGAAVGIGAAIAVTVVVLVEVDHSHHSLSGCVVSGSNGLELQTSDSKSYALAGDAASIRVGDRVKLHGSKVKKTKDTSGDQIFRVASMNKDYGPCKVNTATAKLTP